MFKLADRTSNLKFLTMMNDAIELMRKDSTEWELPASRKGLLEIITVLNFFDEVAGEYLGGLLDEELARENVAYVAVTVCKAATPFLAWFDRTHAEQKAWEKLRELPGKLERVDPAANVDRLIRAGATLLRR